MEFYKEITQGSKKKFEEAHECLTWYWNKKKYYYITGRNKAEHAPKVAAAKIEQMFPENQDLLLILKLKPGFNEQKGSIL